MTGTTPLRWRVLRRLIRVVIWRIARRSLRRSLRHLVIRLRSGDRLRWLRPETDAFHSLWTAEIAALHARGFPAAGVTGGGRLMTELALVTVAADTALRKMTITPECSREIVADIGWKLYRQMLLLTSLPYRAVTRNPERRLRWTLRTLLVFPFRPVGAPGYAAEILHEPGMVRTYFTHCPPQSLARAISEQDNDPDVLAAFRQSWCLYDWPGADLIASDGQRGHYRRARTLSHGDPVCDMCWSARASGVARHSGDKAAPPPAP